MSTGEAPGLEGSEKMRQKGTVRRTDLCLEVRNIEIWHGSTHFARKVLRKVCKLVVDVF